MPINNRVMPDCIVITARNTRELYGCAEGLKRCARQPEEDGAVDRSVSGGLNYTDDLSEYKRGGRTLWVTADKTIPA